MRCSVEVLLVIFGCAFTLATARSITQESLTRVARSPTDEHPGTPEAIRAKPEDTAGYVAFAKNNFQGIQGTVDVHFAKKKQEGNVIEELGVLTEKIAAEGKEKVEKLQYDSMKEAFEDFNSARSDALGALLHDPELEGGPVGGAGGGAGAGAAPKPAGPPPKAPASDDSDEAPAAAPAPAPAPAADDDDDDDD